MINNHYLMNTKKILRRFKLKASPLYWLRYILFIFAEFYFASLQGQSHTIKHFIDRGETLESIATLHHTSVNEILRLNPLAGQLTYVGMELEIPAKTYANEAIYVSDNKTEISDNNTEISFLSHSHSRPKSTSKKDSKFLKSYYKLFNKLESAKNNKEVAKVHNKLLNFFYKNTSGRNRDIAQYQLGHYYAFGCFDKYFDGNPSDIDRSDMRAIDTRKATYYLNMVPKLYGSLRLIPKTWMYDIDDAIRLLADHGRINDDDIIEYLDNHPEISVNIYNTGRKILDYCDINCGKVKHQSPIAVQDLISMAYNLNDSHPIKQQLMPYMTAAETAALAYKYSNRGDTYNSLFYSCLAAYKGDPNGVLLFVKHSD